MFVSKYSASGNDFVICHGFIKKDRASFAKEICNRFNGVGADGFVVVLPHAEYDFEWEFYNSDGSVASMCGNASRAVAHYALDQGLCKQDLVFLTQAGAIKASVEGDFVTSDLTKPVILDKELVEYDKKWSLIDTGVPHLVSHVGCIESFDLQMAKELRQKYNANVNIWCHEGNTIYVRTYERGVEDETLACGTGMAACFLQGLQSNSLPAKVVAVAKSMQQLHLEYKDQIIKFGGKVKKVFVTEYKEG